MLLGSNPFLQSFINSDNLGKVIFILIFTLSIVSWVIIISKTMMTKSVFSLNKSFSSIFHQQKQEPLKISYKENQKTIHPFYSLYLALKQQTLEILAKNRAAKTGSAPPVLSHTDIEQVESYLFSHIASINKSLEKNLYLLSTVYTLAPFLGLLGTVWGILSTFAELQAGYGNASEQMLSGLSLALATTVLGLLAAIPALVGYHYLKNQLREHYTDMEVFANTILSSVEFHYRQVDAKM